MRYTTNFPTVRGDETVLVQGMASRMSPSTSFGTGTGIAVGTCGNSGSRTLWKDWTIGKLWNNRFQTSWSSDLSKVKKHNKDIFLPFMGAENKSTPAPGLEIYRGRILSTIFRWRITCPSLLGSGSPARVSDPVTSAFSLAEAETLGVSHVEELIGSENCGVGSKWSIPKWLFEHWKHQICCAQDLKF